MAIASMGVMAAMCFGGVRVGKQQGDSVTGLNLLATGSPELSLKSC